MADDADPAGELTMLLDDDVVDVEDYGAERSADDADGTPDPRDKEPMSAVRRATLLGLAVAAALAVLVGWLGFRAYQSELGSAQRNQFLQVARQGALNLTTIDWQRPKAMCSESSTVPPDSSTTTSPSGHSRSLMWSRKPNRQRWARSPRRGWNRETADSAQVLVAVTVTTSNVGAPQPDPHAWRMRISVQKVGDQAKVSNVEFVA